MTTFIITDKDGDTIEVQPLTADLPASILVNTYEAFYTEEQAPALALAILEAAGYTAGTGGAVEILRRLVAQRAEAADQAKLEAEAAVLFETFNPETNYQWPGLLTQKAWIEVAKKAREIHKVTD